MTKYSLCVLSDYPKAGLNMHSVYLFGTLTLTESCICTEYWLTWHHLNIHSVYCRISRTLDRIFTQCTYWLAWYWLCDIDSGYTAKPTNTYTKLIGHGLTTLVAFSRGVTQINKYSDSYSKLSKYSMSVRLIWQHGTQYLIARQVSQYLHQINMSWSNHVIYLQLLCPSNIYIYILIFR